MSLIPDGFTAEIFFGKVRKTRKIQPHVPLGVCCLLGGLRLLPGRLLPPWASASPNRPESTRILPNRPESTRIVIPCSCPFKKGMGLDFTIFSFFSKTYFDQKWGYWGSIELILKRSTTQSWSPIDPRGSRSILKFSICLVQKIIIFYP